MSFVDPYRGVHSADGKNWYNHEGEQVVRYKEDPNVPEGHLVPAEFPAIHQPQRMHEDGRPCDCDLNGLVEYLVPCAQEATQEFMEAAGQLNDIGFFTKDHPIRQARHDMMFKRGTSKNGGRDCGEMYELYYAHHNDDLVEYVDGCADVIWIAWGSMFQAVGPVIAAEIMTEVNRSNLDKINGKHGPIVWAGEPGRSKVLKPEGWRGPDVEGIFRRHGLIS